MNKKNYEMPSCSVLETATKMPMCVSDWPGQIEAFGEEDFVM